MEFPGRDSWEFFDVDSYRRACDASTAQPAHAPQSPSSPPAASPDHVLNQLADLQLGRAGRRRVSNAGGTPAPRNALAGRVGSMRRLPGPLIAREQYLQSARYDVPASLPENSAPYAARHSTSGTMYVAHDEAAPRRKGGLMSGLRKAFGLGGRRKDASDIASSGRHSIDIVRRDSTFPMDAPEPMRGRVHYAPRDEDQDRIRREAGAAMYAEETTLPPPVPRNKDAYEQDVPLISRMWEGLTAGNVPPKTRSTNGNAIVHLSAWLKQVGKAPMEGRLFTADLKSDAWKFVRRGGDSHATAALDHLQEMESNRLGMVNIARREQRRDRQIPPDDAALIDTAFGKQTTSKWAARAFSAWLLLNKHAPLSNRKMLLSDTMDRLVEEYQAIPRAPYATGHVPSAVNHLRNFVTHSTTEIKTRSSHFGIPEVDERLIGRYRIQGNAALRSQAQQENKPVRVNRNGRTKFDDYALATRAFSDWLQQQGRPNIAERLHLKDGNLMADLERFDEKKGSKYRMVRLALGHMISMFPPEAPEVTIARIGRERFVNALGSFVPDSSVANLAVRVGADVDDLLVFLDASSATGLTQAGEDLLKTFDGHLRQVAGASIGQRQQWMAMAARGMGQTSMSPILATPVGWSGISWPVGADSAYEGLSPFTALPGSGQEACADTPSEVAGPSRPAQENADVDDYPSPQTAPPGVAARRLAHEPWLHDDDLHHYNQVAIQRIAQELGPDGYQRLTGTLDIADPLQVQQLDEGSAQKRAEVLQHFNAPILFLPLNHANRHWSLLVINRPAQQAFHYDSKIPPGSAHMANDTAQFEVARRVANVLNAGTPMGMPMALQPDDNTCGDHVLAGIETLARRIMASPGNVPMDLSDIQPSREHIVASLTWYEQYFAQTSAAQAAQLPGQSAARPRKRR
ncbi:Ulp1 family isopeptidase [Paraburkholderia sp. JPY419]|uniref:Ulp1 family isopeptidase n=1 Tax=Paraburkholderia sp. JPY419 TaxID=667660 RepID=UPI003D215E3B